MWIAAERNKIIAFLITSLLVFMGTPFSWAQFAEGPEVNQNPLTVFSVRVKDDAIKPGQLSEVNITWDLADKHHAYLDQFKLKALKHEEVEIIDFTISPVVDFTDVISGKIKEGTKGRGNLRATIKVPEKIYGGKKKWPLQLTYQACTDEYCLFPKNIPVEAILNIDAPEKPFNFSALFGGEGSGELFEKARDLGWFFTFFIVFLAGIITSFTPCIFPMIPITLAVLGTRTQGQTRLQGFSISLAYVLGIAVTYSILGVVAASTGALFGALLGSPIAVSAIAFVFVTMALSMFGFFEIKAPDWLNNKLGQVQANGKYLGAFLAGLIAGIIASPCVGPVLAGVLLYVATTKDVVLGFFLLFTFAIGLGLIFLVLGTFTHLINKLPKSGAWLDRTKYVFGIVMLLMAAYFVYPVLKPYVAGPPPLVDRCEDNLEHCKSGHRLEGDFARPDWKTYSDKLLEKAKQEGRPVIIDFQAEWCIACKELEAFTFSDDKVMALGKDFLWLYFDATHSSDELLKLRKKYSIVGLPMVLFYDKKGEWRKDLTLTGFEKAEEFIKRMEKASQ